MRETWKKWTRYFAAVIVIILVFQTFGLNFEVQEVEAKSSYDIVVIGSEIQGVLLAKAAKEEGLDVLILDPRSKPGGELIQGQMQVLDETNDKKGKSVIQGEIKKLFDAYNAGTIRKAKEFESYYNKLLKGITVQSGITIQSVDETTTKSGKSIQSISYRANDGKTYTVRANYWVENTDHNALTAKLDVKRIPGMESLYNGKKADYMAATYMIRLKKVNWSKLHQAILKDYPLTNVQKKYGPNTYVDWDFATGFSNTMIKYKPTDSQLKLRGLNVTYQKHGQAIVNALLIYDVDPSNAKSVENAVKKGKAEAPHVLKYLQDTMPGFEQAELNGFVDYLYIRDYNRYETKYVLDYPDLKSSRMFWDNVTLGSYAIDLQGTRALPLGIGFGKPDRYGIPLRSFLLKSYDNVIVVGKNVGATIKAYGSARVMATTAMAGQSIGIIIGRESKLNKHLNELTQADFQRIHKYLAKDYKLVVDK